MLLGHYLLFSPKENNFQINKELWLAIPSVLAFSKGRASPVTLPAEFSKLKAGCDKHPLMRIRALETISCSY